MTDAPFQHTPFSLTTCVWPTLHGQLSTLISLAVTSLLVQARNQGLMNLYESEMLLSTSKLSAALTPHV
jgi:hypothetical protein